MKNTKLFLLMVATLLCSFAVNAQDGADVTGLFVNTDFETGNTTGWTISGPTNANPGTMGTAPNHGYQGTYFMEAWKFQWDGVGLSDFEWSQTQTVPNGTYVVTALAHAKDERDASVAPQGTYIFAEDQQVAITTVTASEYSVTVDVTDGTLTIGYRGVGCNANWAACDDFRITRQIDTNAEYTVTFYDWDDTVLKTETVKGGQSVTPPADPKRLGYTFTGWDKTFSTVVSDLEIHASYTRNIGGVINDGITGIEFLNTDFETGNTTGWTISGPANAINLGAQGTAASHGYQGTYFMEAWRDAWGGSLGDFEWSQTQTVPNGTYVVTALAHAKDERDASVAPQGTYIFAEDQQVAITTVTASEYSVTVDVTDGTLTIGYRGVGCNANWAACDDFGVSVSELDIDTDAEYTVTFYDWDGTVLKTETVKQGQSPTAPANPVRDGYAFAGWDINYVNVFADLVVYATYSTIDNLFPEVAPRAEYWYDFEGVGEKGFVMTGGSSWGSPTNPYYTAGISQQFKTLKSYSGSAGDFYYVEDLDGDGVMDFSAGYSGSYISQGDSHAFEDGALIIANFDVNNDGRIDYLKSRGDSYSGYSIMVQQADGSFVEQFMQVVTEAEYEASFDPDDWYSTNTNSKPRPSPVRFSGVWLASAPPRRETNAPQMRAQGMNPTVAAPTRALDLNADGYVDLIDEKNGVLYYNGGDGRWIYTELGGSVMIADLNGDHIQDFIFPGQELWVAVYRGEGDFEMQTLYENIQVDREMYCYDFDRDGDVDILVTFSAPLNSTGYAYTMFFDNDGTGQFTQLDEQDYGNNNLLFSNCQDLDGDGYYDLLAFRGDFDGYTNRDIVWLKGQPGKTFAQAESLVTLADGYTDVYSAKISVEDINNDGRMDMWANIKDVPAYSFVGAANAAPTAPSKPELNYNNGMLTVSWGDGSDDRTATSDLTYALRVGTTPGGDDILRAHANADGSRRNFLDGNMSRFHNYTLNLTQRQPATIYVSVQTIDAQHVGSAWSEEASIEHTGFVADFRVSRTELGCGEKLIATATAMPDGFTHTWTAEDGECTGDGYEAEIVFNAAGEKAITHTLTAADGTSTSYVEMVNVTPNYTDLAEIFGTEWDDFLESNNTTGSDNNLPCVMADYNMDGYWDVADAEGDYAEAIFKGGENFSFAQAAGIWNTGLTMGRGFWYDWDHNGAMDYLFDGGDEIYYYLPHNGTTNMKAKKEDENLAVIFDSFDEYKFESSYVDFTHDGNFDLVGHKMEEFADNKWFYKNYLGIRQSDGSYQARFIVGDSEQLLPSFKDSDWFFADINRDGFTDMCAVLKVLDISTGLYFYRCLTVLVNKGNCEFEAMTIPFAEELSYDNDDVHNTLRHLVDMNNDGYLDFLSMRADGAPYVLWNEENERFCAPDILPVGELGRYSSGYNYMQVIDLDNNGYLDVMTNQQDESKGSAGYGYYVHYFGAEGVIQQGFVLHCSSTYVLEENAIKLPNHPWAFCLNWYDIVGPGNYAPANFGIVTLHSPANERPAAPTDMRAVQTDKGLLIEWNHAKDDATPGTQMRYNLSVKKKDASGEGAYIISPQNACNSSAAPIRNFNYITAKQYLVPNSVLPIGEYEIQLQAIDLQGDWSVFTEPLTVSVEEVYAIGAPASVCSGEIAQFTYTGSSSTETPVWDFDGAKVESGSGYGPYHLSWNAPGTKTVSLTLGDKVMTRMIYVEDSNAGVFIPTLFNHTTTEIKIPEGVTVEWLLSTTGESNSYYPLSALSDYDKEQIKIEGNKITLNTSYEKLYFKMTQTNASGCETMVVCDREILGLSDLIPITVVTADAEGHNVIRWNSTDMCAEVRILKETNRRNRYVEIGVANVSDGAYTDYSSNAAIQSECYVLQAVLPDVEVPVPYSSPHTTSHLTINRGLTNNTWNLIWSGYEGANVVGYNILRGTSPDDLEEIGSVSNRHSSYTDYAPDANAPYYAIEYILGNGAAYAPDMNRAVARATELKGQSNVVNSNMANTMVYANSVSVLSATNKYATTEDNLSLALYAEILPAAATSRSVRWDIVNGEDLATITSGGVLTAKNPNAGGTVTVQATTVDGTNITATRTITIAPIGEVAPEPEPETTYTVTFYDWNSAVLKTQTVKQGESATAPTPPIREGYTFTGWDKDFTNVQYDMSTWATYTKNSQPVTTYTVKFCDWNGTVLKTQTVQPGQSATAPTAPTREGYTFSGWDKVFTNVQGDLFVYAMYTQNSIEPDPDSELKYTTQFNAGANGWIDGTVWHNQTEKIAVYTSPLYRAQGGKVTKLRITVNRTKGNTKYFCLSELELYDANGNKIALSASNVTSNADHNALNAIPDGGGFAALFDGQTSTYFHSAWQNMPSGDHYLEVTLPNGGYDAFSFKMLSRARTIENGKVYDQSHTFPGVMVMATAVELVVSGTLEPEPEYTVTFYDWNNTVLKTQKVKKGESATAPANPTRSGYTFAGWDKAFTNVQSDLSVHAIYAQNSVEPKPELDNDAVYYVSQPYNGGTSWAIATGGSAMNINTKLGITANSADARQQFAFITNDGGKTHYLYHPAEKKYVNKDNSLSATPRDPVYFMAGEYENTFVVYFDESHVINTNSTDGLIINRWGPLSGWGKADGGNSCLFTAVGRFDLTDIDFLYGEGFGRVQKVFENGEMFILLPDGSKYTMTGVKVK